MNKIVVFLLLSLIGIVVFIIFYLSKREKLDNFSNYLLILASSFIAFGIYAPFGFTDKDKVTEFIDTGQIGDTIGGIMNPFIAISAVIVTGLAFYEQYNANKKTSEQFELQKFKNQLYEMLRLHKENVNEIELETADGKEVVKGRAVFFEMKIELEILIHLFKNHSELDEKGFEYLYNKFFFGNRKTTKDLVLKYRNDDKQYTEFNKDMEKYSNGEQPNCTLDMGGTEETTSLKSNLKPKIKRMEGVYIYLGHYYRHLFHIVKFVVNQKENLISEDRKIEYLRILRNQLSNYEQEMLFYNWLSGYGGAWENKNNHFFTKYKMIHNIWYSELYENSFVKQKLKDLVKKYKELGGKGNLFEIGDDIDKNFS